MCFYKPHSTPVNNVLIERSNPTTQILLSVQFQGTGKKEDNTVFGGCH